MQTLPVLTPVMFFPRLSPEERAHVEAQLDELTATYNQLCDSSTQQLQQLEQQLAIEEEKKVYFLKDMFRCDKETPASILCFWWKPFSSFPQIVCSLASQVEFVYEPAIVFCAACVSSQSVRFSTNITTIDKSTIFIKPFQTCIQIKQKLRLLLISLSSTFVI